MSAPVLALDVGGTTTRAARVEGNAIVWRAEAPTPARRGPDAVIGAALDLLGGAGSGATALGVAMTGRVVRGRVTALNTETLPGWTDVPLAERLAGALGLPTAVLNDARAAAWGEFAAGAGRGTSEFAFVTVSTGVGAGLVLGGRLHEARNGLDAELGFTLVPGGRYAAPGLPGLSALEFEASGSALDARGGARALLDAAEAGDPGAAEEVGRAAGLVAWRVADLAALLGVERVALGGSVGLRAGFRSRVTAALAALPDLYRVPVVPAELGADAGLVGAALWTQERRG